MKIWIHLVWTTKRREPLLTREIRPCIFRHIRENARRKGIFIDHINGYDEHVHCLISLRVGQNIDKVLMLLKGESSNWINKNNLIGKKFEWQKEYFAASVSESGINRVREYIRNQERHHKKRSYNREWKEIEEKYKFETFVSG